MLRRALIAALGLLLNCRIDAGHRLQTLKTVSFAATSDNFLNPERGYVAGWDIIRWDPAGERAKGRSMVRGFVNLANYRNSALDETFLHSLDNGLARVRGAHIKTTLRFKYNNGESYPYCPEASKAQMLRHIHQLAPILQKYADVIVSQEAGFIGCWGEWSGSSPVKNTDDEADVLKAMLNALPDRSVQVRSSTYKAAIYNSPSPMALSDAFALTNRSRTGHYNDCILATQDGQDFTYPTNSVQFWANYVAAETQWLPMGGESCGRTVNVRGGEVPASNCTQVGGQAQTRLSYYHFTYINSEDPVVQTDWRRQGCFTDIGMHLGYRYALTTATYSSSTSPGGILHLAFGIKNSGCASVFNTRPVYAVIDGNSQREELLLNTDPRLWAPRSVQTISLDVRVPSSMAEGTYRLSLWLPDQAAIIKHDSLYAIRLANENTWDPSGLNVIATSLAVSRSTVPQPPTYTGPVHDVRRHSDE